MLISRFRAGAFAVLVTTATAVAADHPVTGDSLYLKDSPDANRRVVRFRAVRDPAIDPGVAADPRGVGATIEVTGSSGGDGATGSITLEAARWTGLGKPPGAKGYKFFDPNQTTGVRKVFFQTSRRGGSLLLSGGRSAWPYRITQPQSPIDVRFTIGSDIYCAEFTSFARNRSGRVIARHALAPASCAGPASAMCGNGTAEGAEECDDGNTTDGDGCSATCQLESTAALCAGVPAVPGTALDAVRVASGLNSPVHVTAPRLDPHRLFVVEQPGRIRIIKNGTLLPAAFLAIEGKVGCCGEHGLLSIAFHPDYESNGRFFVNYTDNAGNTVIARYQVSGDPDVADAASEQILLTIAQPFANHNGGLATFGPDGYLYVGMGDGGSGDDPFGNGQSDATLLGKMLRIDVDVETPPYHAVPPSNPNAGVGDPLGLIWAKGLRNPWRYSFDRTTGDLYVGDVGQNQWEEVDLQPAASVGGENYGWDVVEARHCHEPPVGCSTAGMTMPVLEYSHAQGCSITGGFVYRGCRMPDLHGTYFYSDFCSSFVRTFRGVSGGDAQNLTDRTADAAPGGGLTIDNVTSFGEDARGELYVTDYDGEVYELVPGS
jgi:cysteine-rich repeat protein